MQMAALMAILNVVFGSICLDFHFLMDEVSLEQRILWLVGRFAAMAIRCCLCGRQDVNVAGQGFYYGLTHFWV
jgi:hypothetical protein